MDIFDALGTFVRVVERGSFSAAAQELGVGQPAVSKQIGALEQYLGGALFARSTRRLSLTDRGQQFYGDCKRILAAFEAATLSFATGQEKVAGQLRVAAPVSYGRRCIAPLLGDFLALYPEVRVDLRLSDHNEDLLKENIDLAIRIGAIKSEGLVALPLGESKRRVYASPSYLQRCGTPETPADLAAHNCVGFTLLDHYDIWRFRQGNREQQVKISGSVTSNSSEAIREIVLSGLGISLSPEWLFRHELESGEVIAILADFETIALPVNAVFSPDRRQSARTKAFIDFLRAAEP